MSGDTHFAIKDGSEGLGQPAISILVSTTALRTGEIVRCFLAIVDIRDGHPAGVWLRDVNDHDSPPRPSCDTSPDATIPVFLAAPIRVDHEIHQELIDVLLILGPANLLPTLERPSKGDFVKRPRVTRAHGGSLTTPPR